MQIKMIKTAAGPAGNFIAGTVHVVDEELGRSLVEAGAAVAELQTSKAAVEPVEVAAVDPVEEKADAPPQETSRKRRTSKAK